MPVYRNNRLHLAGYVAGQVAREGYRRFRPYLRRFALGPGAVAAAAAANYFRPVPKLNQEMRYLGNKRPRQDGVVHDRGGYAQFTKARNSKSGRWRSKKMKVSKLINAHTGDYIERFQNVTPLAVKGGAYPLTYNQVGDVNIKYEYPVYMFDLTCARNRWAPAPNVAPGECFPYPMTRLTNDFNTFTFQNIAGRSNADVEVFSWTDERYPHGSLTSSATKQFIDWADIRLILYGARKYPTYCWVEIWQFKDRNYVPQSSAFNAATGLTVKIDAEPDVSADRQQFNQFWSGQIDNLIGNPLSTRDLKEFDISRVAYKKFSKKFVFQPTLTTESDVCGHQIEFKLRHGINKVCNYVENPIDFADVPRGDLDNANQWNVYDRSNNSPFISAKGREFLVVRGFAPVKATVEDPLDTSISFDLMVRRKRTQLQGV